MAWQSLFCGSSYLDTIKEELNKNDPYKSQKIF
jgi:hypothetical protein